MKITVVGSFVSLADAPLVVGTITLFIAEKVFKDKQVKWEHGGLTTVLGTPESGTYPASNLEYSSHLEFPFALELNSSLDEQFAELLGRDLVDTLIKGMAPDPFHAITPEDAQKIAVILLANIACADVTS